MSPLQKWMSDHGHPGWYSWLVVIGGALVSMLISITVSVTLGKQQLERERQQEIQAAKQAAAGREAARNATCLVIRTMAEVYGDPEPTTATGRKAATAWADLGRIFGCKE
jgi:hypothetical protein